MRLKQVAIAMVCVSAVLSGEASATEWIVLSLPARVESSDAIVIARVVDAERGVVAVERTLKGSPPGRVALTRYVDGMVIRAQQQPLVQGARELMFLTKDGDLYAPVQTQWGRFPIVDDRIVTFGSTDTVSLASWIVSIERLVAIQSRATGRKADAAFIEALNDRDPDVRAWAIDVVSKRITSPSARLVDAVLAKWRTNPGEVGNAMLDWRIRGTAQFFAKAATSRDDEERAWAAVALGASGDEQYAPLLRRMMTTDSYWEARAFAAGGLMEMLGPRALADLRVAARDGHEKVRVAAAYHALNMLELLGPRHFGRASNASIAEARTFVTPLLEDESQLVRDGAKVVLAYIAEQTTAR